MSKIDNFAYPTPIPAKIWGCSPWSRSVMLRSAESEMVRLIAVKLFSQNSNLCDRDTISAPLKSSDMLALYKSDYYYYYYYYYYYLNVTDRRTDRQTDGRTTCHGNTALRVASRGNYTRTYRIWGADYIARWFTMHEGGHIPLLTGLNVSWKFDGPNFRVGNAEPENEEPATWKVKDIGPKQIIWRRGEFIVWKRSATCNSQQDQLEWFNCLLPLQ